MNDNNPTNYNYDSIHIFGIPALYIDIRLDRSQLPKGVYCYEVQHDDEHKGIITMIGHHIMVNHWGTVLTTKQIPLNYGYREVDEDTDIQYHDKTMKLDEFIKENKSKKKAEIETR